MGFLGKMIAKAVVEKIEDVALYNVADHMSKTHSVEAIVGKSTAEYRMFIKKKCVSIKRGFTVYDESNNKKYLKKLHCFLSFPHLKFPCNYIILSFK